MGASWGHNLTSYAERSHSTRLCSSKGHRYRSGGFLPYWHTNKTAQHLQLHMRIPKIYLTLPQKSPELSFCFAVGLANENNGRVLDNEHNEK